MRVKTIGLLVARLLWVLSILGVSLEAFSRESDDWPRHRGDAALKGNSGQKMGSSLKLSWVFDAGDFLKSSVVVSGGIAYIGADTGILHALDAKSGKEKWKYKTSLGIEAPPLVHGGILSFQKN